MALAVVIGEPLLIGGYSLAGALLRPASDQAAAQHAWRDLPADVAVAILTRQAARWLAGELATRPQILPVVMPSGDDADRPEPPAQAAP